MKSGMATLTSKGQLTIPAEIREALRLQSGDRVEFILDDFGAVQVRALNKGPEAFLNALEPRNPDPVYASDDDAIMAELEADDLRSLPAKAARSFKDRAA
jgi:antitoxin PrlF